MKFLANSTNEKYTRRLNSYGREKLEKPLVRHKFDSDNVTIRADIEETGNKIQLRVVVMIPGESKQLISATEEDINAVIDVGIASVNQKKTMVNVIPSTTLELYSRP